MNKKLKKYKDIILFATMVIGGYMVRYNNIMDERKLMRDGELTIAEVIKANKTKLTNRRASVTFEFYHEGKLIHYAGYKYPDQSKFTINKGDKYLVVYYPNEPRDCELIYDYLIKDSADYKVAIREFENTREQRSKRKIFEW